MKRVLLKTFDKKNNPSMGSMAQWLFGKQNQKAPKRTYEAALVALAASPFERCPHGDSVSDRISEDDDGRRGIRRMGRRVLGPSHPSTRACHLRFSETIKSSTTKRTAVFSRQSDHLLAAAPPLPEVQCRFLFLGIASAGSELPT